MLIVFATDGTGDDTAAATYANALGAACGGRVATVHAAGTADDVADDVIETIRALGPELVVLGTHARRGVSALAHGSVAEAIVRNIAAPALVVPDQCPAFVDARGAIDLRHVAVPARDTADEQRGMALAHWFVALAGHPVAEIEVVHALAGPVLRGASLIVMTTHGHDGVGDVVRGSHTERVIRDAACPVLVQNVTT